MILPHFIGPSYTSESPNADAEQCMNWYVEAMESDGAKVPTALYPCPGFTAWGSVVKSPVRGVFATGALTDRLFAVIDDTLYEFTSAGTATSRGTVAVDINPATFSTNGAAGEQMMVTSGGVLYCYDLLANTLAEVLTFSGAGITILAVDFLDEFFLALDAINSVFYVSDENDGSSWDLTQYAARSAASDPWIAMKVIHKEIWLMGTLTSEVWYNAGSAPFPFAPIPGAFLEQGTASAFSLNNVDSTLAWLGRNSNGQGIVWRSQGYVPVRISTHAVEKAISSYGAIDNAVSFTYQDQGHSFYVLTFPNDATWVYDTRTGLWHERGYWNSGLNQFDPYRPLYHASAFNQHLVGDSASGAIFTMAITVATDVDGLGIRRVRRSPHQWDGQEFNTVFFRGLQIDMQTGLGLSGGSEPQVTLGWSDDGGQTYPTDIQQPASAGALGDLQTRVIFLQLGSSRDRVWQLVVNDAVYPWAILQAAYRPDPVIGRN